MTNVVGGMTAQGTAQALLSRYRAAQGGEQLRALVIGGKGAGKTYTLKTAVKPVLLDVFDPDGEQCLLNDKGQCPDWLVVRRYPTGSPEEFGQWLKDMKESWEVGLFQQFGTYALDGITSWTQGLKNHMLARVANKPRADGKGVHSDGFELPDWGKFGDEISYWMKRLTGLPCDVITFGHIDRGQDEVLGKTFYKVMCQGSSTDKIPTLFSEFYVLEATPHANGPATAFTGADNVDRAFITRLNGMFGCCSRLGRPTDSGKARFEARELPDYKALRRKAGLGDEDKPLFWLTGGPEA